MESIVELMQQWGLWGLVIVTFTESFISPILPDVILLPMALANPENAIYYGALATVISVLGGFIGYYIGSRWGMPVVHRIMPAKYAGKIEEFAQSKNVSLTIFLAALSPIPYKCVSLSAGAFKVKLHVFIIVSILGRAKRFFLIGVLVYYIGPAAVDFFEQNSRTVLLLSLIFAAVCGMGIYLYRRYRRRS